MKKITIKAWLICLISVLFLSAICTCFVAFNTKDAHANQVDYVENQISDYYSLGQTFVSPEAKVVINGTPYLSNKQVLFCPDGSALSSNEYVLTNPGKYYLRYYTTHNGKTVYAQDEFVVKDSVYSVSGPMSSAYYGNSGAKGNLDGLLVSVAPGDVFTYNKPIDLNNKLKTDKLITLFALPERQGIADVKQFKIRLTDVADEENFVEIIVFAASDDDNELMGNALWYGARGNNQTFTGMHYKGYNPDPESQIIYDNNYYSIYKNINYTARVGYPSFGASLAASRGYGFKADTDFRLPFGFAYDINENKVYGTEIQTDDTKNGWGRMYGNRLIADLDDTLFFDNAWGGFTTGEVYLSIYSDNYVNSSFNFVITGIYEEDLSSIEYENDNAPKIIVDLPEGDLPYALEGVSYKVFNANAYSGVDGKINCQALVYSDYYSNARKIVAVKNGAFVPTESALSYSIVYTATDSFGNYAEKVVDIKTKKDRVATINLEGEITTAYAGETITLKKPVAVNANGEYTIEVKVGDEIITPNKNGEYKFLTLKAGDYTVKYILTDYNGELEVAETLTVQTNPYSVFVGESTLPKVFVNGVSYKIPKMLGMSFTDEQSNEITATVKYAIDGGEEKDYVYGQEININGSDKVMVKYLLEGAREPLTFEIPIVDVGLSESKFYKEKYFYSKEFSATSTETCLDYSLDYETTPVDKASLYYVKPILATDFAFEYMLKGSSISAYVIRLTDTADVNNVLEVKIENINNEKVYISINGSTPKEVSKNFSSKKTKVTFNCAVNDLYIDDTKFTVEGLNDFANKTAMFEIEFLNVTDDVGFEIYTVGNNFLDSSTKDYTSAQVYVDVNKGKKVLGDKIIINGVFVEDIISFTSMATLTVKGPDGKVCKNANGVVMSDISDFSTIHEIVVDQFGTYKLVITFSDKVYDGEMSRPETMEIKINSYDEVAPVITLSGTKISAAYVGQTYSLATATAVDNVDGNVNVVIMVMGTDSKMHLIKDAKFTFSSKGVYKVMYYAVDSFGNVAFESYDVVAVEKEG